MSDRSAFADLGRISLETFEMMPGRVLVHREPPPTHYGKIELIQDDANARRFKPTTGVVVKLGPKPVSERTGVSREWQVKEGERVIINRFAGHDCIINGDPSYNIMEEYDIIGVIEEGATLGP